jgi:hypothetical protein
MPNKLLLASLVSALVASVGAQTRAPHNDSIRQSDLRADLSQYDRPEKIDYVKMEKIARLVHQASWDIANADARPKAPVVRTNTH